MQSSDNDSDKYSIEIFHLCHSTAQVIFDNYFGINTSLRYQLQYTKDALSAVYEMRIFTIMARLSFRVSFPLLKVKLNSICSYHV